MAGGLGEGPGAAGEDLAHDRARVRVVGVEHAPQAVGERRGQALGRRRAVASGEDVAGADALAYLQLAVRADVSAARVGEVLEGTRDQRLGRPGGSRGRERDGRPPLVHDLADVAGAGAGHADVRRRPDLEHARRDADVPRRQDRVAQVLLVCVLDEVRVGREREVGDPELGERRQPDLGVLERRRPEAVADDAGVQTALAGALRRREHDGVRQRGLAALEVDVGDAEIGRLVDDARELRQRHRAVSVRRPPDETVVAGVGAAIRDQEVDAIETDGHGQSLRPRRADAKSLRRRVLLCAQVKDPARR